MAAARSPEISVRPSPSTARAERRGRSMRAPKGCRAGVQSRSRMEALAFGVEGAAKRDCRSPLPPEMIDAQALTHAHRTVLDETEGDWPPERRAHIARSHVTERAARLAHAFDEMRAGRQRRFP